MFPERGIVFDFFFQKVGSTWAAWEDLIEKSTTIPQGAKVHYRDKDFGWKIDLVFWPRTCSTIYLPLHIL